jgi:hypothetical protein
MQIKILTVVDITETMRNRNDKTKEYKQQCNFNTVLQTIAMKANPYYTQSPTVESIVVDKLSFGSNIKGEHNVWSFIVDIEYEDSIVQDDLQELFDLIPVILDLDETVKINKGVFHTKDKKFANIVFKLLS